MGLTNYDKNSPRAKKNQTKQLEQPSVAAVDLATLKQPPKPQREPDAEPLDLPQLVQMSFSPYRAWDPGSLLTAKAQADSGNFEMPADLIESMLADTVISGCLNLRVNGLAGLPQRFVGGNAQVLEAVSSDYWIMETAGEAQFRRMWGLLLNLVPVYVRELVEVEGRIVPRLEPWNPRWLRCRWEPTGIAWFILTAQGEIRLSDYPGRWFLYCPLGYAGGRPWVQGLWYSLCTWWLAKSFAIADLAAFGQSHATPKWFLSHVPGEEGQAMVPGSDKDAAKRSAIRFLSKIPERSGMYIPRGFMVKQEETNSYSWQAFGTTIDKADAAMTRDILGSDAGTTANATYASAYTGDGVRWDLMIADADAEASFMHDGPLTLWHALNFRNTKRLEAPSGNVLEMLQDRRTGTWTAQPAPPRVRLAHLSEDGAYRHQQFLLLADSRVREGDEVPWPVRDTTPPEDLAKIAQTQGAAADALVKLTGAAAADPAVAAAVAQMDLPRYLARYFPMLDQDESGIQLDDSRTHFPKRGDDRAVTLRSSEYDTFDASYVAELREAWPEIWELTESQGDKAHAQLLPVVDRGGAPETDEETAAIRQRETWASSHYGNNRLAGVIALMKWFVVGRIGSSKMKDLVEERKDLVRSRRARDLEHRGPELLLETPRNVRQHLHDGLLVVDETVDQLQGQNPEAVGPSAQEILRVLTDANGYSDARQRLLAAFPTMDRDTLRQHLTGAMLISQAAGRVTVRREAE